ncbi:MAG: DUF3516 domain-containing protein, partial [Verrucomicrobiales bacterium]|nr:DUF3516 domain-containing protein [Verrucomicrobiales bacterium]
GVNVPIRTVLFTGLSKYDGKSTRTLTVRDFKQIAGRAGRRGFDTIGYVVAQAPEHVIANKKLEAKAAANPGKKSKFVKKKPPAGGFVGWDEKTFQKLITSPPEPLTPTFAVSHSTVLNVLSRENQDGCAALKSIITESHVRTPEKKALRRQAARLFTSLVRGDILSIIPPAERTTPTKVHLNIDLQQDFSILQALGLYLIETAPLLDRESPTYVLDLISLAEAIVENPTAILIKQTDAIKTELMADLKNQGVEYDERIARLEEVEYPKPGKDFIYDTFNKFAAKHPWVSDENIRPKSIAREMFEHYQSFEDYIKTYKLQRSEAVLLRHLSEVYKILDQTVPPSAKTPDVEEAEAFFETTLRSVDSSLLDEWQRLRDPDYSPAKPAPQQKPTAFTRDKKNFTRHVRKTVFDTLKSLANNDPKAALTNLSDHSIKPGDLQQSLDTYLGNHARIRLDPEARSNKHTHIKESPDSRHWHVAQTLVDPDEQNDCTLDFVVDLDASDAANAPSLTLNSLTTLA